MRTPIRIRIIAVAFGAGAVAHTAGLLALIFHRELPGYAGYPAWRHLVFAAVDTTLAYLAAVRPRLLLVPLAAFFAQQMSTHGSWAWTAWATRHEIDGFDLAIVGLELVAVLVSLDYALQPRGASQPASDEASSSRGQGDRGIVAPRAHSMTRSAGRWLAVIATVTVGIVVCIVYVDRPVADFIHAHFYGTVVFNTGSRILRPLPAFVFALAVAFLACEYWNARGRRLAPWGAVISACSTAAVTALVIAIALKFLIGRSEVYPAYLTRQIYDVHPLHWSQEYGAFPSATATVATAIATVLWRHLPCWRTLWVTMPIVPLAAVLAVNGHWMSDILGGVCLGVVIGVRAANAASQRAQQESQKC